MTHPDGGTQRVAVAVGVISVAVDVGDDVSVGSAVVLVGVIEGVAVAVGVKDGSDSRDASACAGRVAVGGAAVGDGDGVAVGSASRTTRGWSVVGASATGSCTISLSLPSPKLLNTFVRSRPM